jgi:hypothetical protein
MSGSFVSEPLPFVLTTMDPLTLHKNHGTQHILWIEAHGDLLQDGEPKVQRSGAMLKDDNYQEFLFSNQLQIHKTRPQT